MKRVLFPFFLSLAFAGLTGCVVEEGGNSTLTSHSIRHFTSWMVTQSSATSVSAINQMLLEERDINADGFTARAGDGLLFTRTQQDCWEVTGDNKPFRFSLTLLREPATDGYDRWTCRDILCRYDDEEDGGYALLVNDGDIVFEWVTRTFSSSVQSNLEQSGCYRAELFPRGGEHAADWCELSYTAGDLSWKTSRGNGSDYYWWE